MAFGKGHNVSLLCFLSFIQQAPEVHKEMNQHSVESDVFALGATVFNITTGLPPEIKADSPFSWPESPGLYGKYKTIGWSIDVPDNIRDEVIHCVAYNPQERPTLETVQSHFIHAVSVYFVNYF